MEWKKSNHSMSNGDCVEIGGWRKPSRSNPTGCCVEAGSKQGVIGVRDTKEAALGDSRVVLAFGEEAWRAFISRLRS